MTENSKKKFETQIEIAAKQQYYHASERANTVQILP